MRTATRQGSLPVDEENPYWVSFSDIMAGLLIIFILASIVFIIQIMEIQKELEDKSKRWDEQIEEIAKAELVRKNILREIEAELRNKNIPVEVIDNDTVLRVPEDVLTFKSGRFNLPNDEALRNRAREVGQTLFQAIVKEERWKHLDTIFIEGHTDPAPYKNALLKNNWGLSTMRAISLWEFWNETLPEDSRLDELYNHNGKKLFSVSGYAETRRSCESECETAVDKNAYQRDRRIDIRFTVRRPAIEEYQSVKQVIE
jgi:flagellar motor protein MotB